MNMHKSGAEGRKCPFQIPFGNGHSLSSPGFHAKTRENTSRLVQA